MKMDWEGTIFGGITLKWNYEGERWVELSLPGYIDTILARFHHPQPKIPQDSPHLAPPTKFTRTKPTPPSPDESPRLDEKGIKRIQQICGSILWCMWACGITTTKVLNAIGREQAKAIETTRMWELIQIKRALDVSASLLPFVAISVAEAELGGTFYNAKKGKILRLTLKEMVYKQGPTTIFVDNNTASGICNSTIK